MKLSVVFYCVGIVVALVCTMGSLPTVDAGGYSTPPEPSPDASSSAQPSSTPQASNSAAPSNSLSGTAESTPSSSESAGPSPSSSKSASTTPSFSTTPTVTRTTTKTPSSSWTSSYSSTPTTTATNTETPTNTPSPSQTPSPSRTPSSSRTQSPTNTPTYSPTPSQTPTTSSTGSNLPTPSYTPTTVYYSSCRELLLAGLSTGDHNNYYIMADGSPRRVACDMFNGGWTRTVNVVSTSRFHSGNAAAVNPDQLWNPAVGAKFSDAYINSINTVGYFWFKCGNCVNRWYKNTVNTWTSIPATSNTYTWVGDAGRDGTFECSASRTGYIFSDYPCMGTQHTNYAARSDSEGLGCAAVGCGSWGNSGSVWIK